LHKIQLLHQFLTLYEIDCPSKEFHSDLKLHIPFLLLWVLSLLYVWCAYSLFHVDLYELSLQCVHTVDAIEISFIEFLLVTFYFVQRCIISLAVFIF
jgi:hypothetical protein